jgi:hypothetical protein
LICAGRGLWRGKKGFEVENRTPEPSGNTLSLQLEILLHHCNLQEKEPDQEKN